MSHRNSAESIGFVIPGAVLATVVAVMTTLARLLREPGDDRRASAA